MYPTVVFQTVGCLDSVDDYKCNYTV